MNNPLIEPSAWVLVANVRGRTHRGDCHVMPEEQRLGARLETGTKHFSPGTKLWLARPQWGDGYERAKAVGRHRGSKKLVEFVVRVRDLENFRVKREFNPAILERVAEWGPWDEQQARTMAAALNNGTPK